MNRGGIDDREEWMDGGRKGLEREVRARRKDEEIKVLKIGRLKGDLIPRQIHDETVSPALWRTFCSFDRSETLLFEFLSSSRPISTTLD